MADDKKEDTGKVEVLKKVLVVDDEPDLLTVLSDQLKRTKLYDVHVAANYDEAVALLQKQVFNLVVTDIRLPGNSGVDLLKWVKDNQKNTRVVLMTGFSEIKDSIDAAKLGARAFLMKPFTMQNFEKTVQESLMKVAWAEFNESKHAAMTISEFISPSELKYTIYIQLDDGRFMKIGEPGDVVPRDNLLGMREKGINELWLNLEDFTAYKNEQSKVAKAVALRKDLPIENRVKMLKAASELAFETMRVLGVTEPAVTESVEIMNATLQVILDDPKSSPVLQVLEDNNSSVYAHAVTCSVIAAMYTKLLDWSTKKNINTLVMGAFLHDIGMVGLPLALQKKPLHKMTKDEVKKYQEHPWLGLNMVKEMATVPREVGLIIVEHHENTKGTGYPRGLLKSEIFPLARIVSLIDLFADAWEKLSADKRARPHAALSVLDSVVKTDPLAFDRADVTALELILTEADLKKARMKYDSVK